VIVEEKSEIRNQKSEIRKKKILILDFYSPEDPA